MVERLKSSPATTNAPPLRVRSTNDFAQLFDGSAQVHGAQLVNIHILAGTDPL
jgi:hypothetical protein